MTHFRPYLRWVWTLVILAGAVSMFGQADILPRLADLTLPGLGMVLSLFTLQVILSAWRWCFTARQLGLSIVGGDAFREYYLAMFINQVLPGGVLGDANRALRHGAVTQHRSAAIQAVMIERLSGQVVLIVAVIITWAILSPLDWMSLTPPVSTPGLFANIVATGILVAGALVLLVFRNRLVAFLESFRHALWKALLKPTVLWFQLLSSSLVVCSYVLVFLVLAWDMNVSMPTSVLVPCVLGLLLSMAIPLTVAGWGIREGLAGALWLWAGYPAEEGLALSIAYGALFLASSLPGALFVLPRFQGAPSRMSNR